MGDLLPVKSPPLPASDPGCEMYGPAEGYDAQASPIRIQRFLAFLRRLWWVPVLTLLCSLGGAGAYVLWAPPTYVSNTILWETEKLRLPEGAAFVEDVQTYYGTQMELLQSGRLWSLALARLQAGGSNSVPLDADGKPLKVKVQAKQLPKSALFVVSASSGNVDYSQAFLAALISEFLEYKKAAHKLVSGDTLNSISEQVLRLERELKADQEALTAFGRTNNLAILQEEGTISGGYLAKLKTQLSDLQLEARLLDATALEQESGPGQTNSSAYLLDSIRSSAGTAQSSLATADRQAAFKELELLRIERQKLSHYLKDKHPKIVRLDADIERGQKIAELYQNQNRDQLASARQAINMKLESVQSSIKEWEDKVVESKNRIAEAERLKAAVARSQSLYDRLALMLQNVDISRSIDQESLAVLEPASPAKRSFKIEIIVGVLALFVGLSLGLGLVFLVEVRDDRLTSPNEISEKFGGGIVGQVPEVRRPRRGAPLPLVESGEAGEGMHIYCESYRNLRSALLFLPVAAGGERPKVLLITSALPNEGKSSVAANLAKTLALGGSRVLLVDGDLRKGALHKTLGLQGEPGLADLLRQPVDLAKVVQTNGLSRLGFIARGSSLGNTSDLFLGPGMDQFLAWCRQDFDYVLIDSSPVFAADDATTLAPKVDGTLFVVRSGFSGAGAVREALELLSQRQAKVLGLVLNRANVTANSYRYYRYADYHQSVGNDRNT